MIRNLLWPSDYF